MNTRDIDPLELIETHDRKKQFRIQIYEDIYSKCCQKIRYVNDVLYKKECTFNVPEVRWGLPRYHIHAVLSYILIKLRGKGFHVAYIPPTQIYINWRKIVDTLSSPSPVVYEFDLKESTVPKPTNTKLGGDERFERLERDGCGGDCCTKSSPKKKHISRKQRLELARQRNQEEIKSILRSKEGGSSRHKSHHIRIKKNRY